VEDQSAIRSIPLPGIADPFLKGSAGTAAKIAAVETALASPDGKSWRDELGKWAASVVPVELLVPEIHRDWRPLVREAILFVVSKLSASRLAPKIVEQMELGPEVSAGVRLLRFIAKVPGLQKIGQVLARNRQLHPHLRRALIELENGISDVSAEEICSIIDRQLQAKICRYGIKLRPAILSEASVSAVVSFTWHNPATQQQERGVFKVLKPHVAGCYAEDMRILGQLAKHLARKSHLSGARLGRLAETLTEIRLLLAHEVDFRREQETLAGALKEYRALRGVRVPQVIPSLSTSMITALTFERGKKVTDLRAVRPKLRRSLADRLAKVLLAVPALSRDKEAIFHADPHAGNLLYDRRADELVILDWALTERLTRKQRRGVVMLVLMLMLRDADGMTNAIGELCGLPAGDVRLRSIRKHIDALLDSLPLKRLPGPMDAIRLLDTIALDEVRFPAALLMFRKAAFTLEGVVQDVAGGKLRLDSLMANQLLANWKDTIAGLLSVLSARDWIALDWSALTFTSRVCASVLLRPWRWSTELSPKADAKSAGSKGGSISGSPCSPFPFAGRARSLARL